LNNIKQICLGLLNHEDARKAFPVASTAPLLPAPNNQTPLKINAVNNRLPGNTSPSDGDGWSWCVQILPYMEQAALYNRFRDTPIATGQPATKFLAGPINPPINFSFTPATTKDNAIMQQLDTFKCPSFPGADESKQNFITTGTQSKAAVGNYVAVVSTHFNGDGQGTSGVNQGQDPGSNASNPTPFDSIAGASKNKQLAGNGAIPHWNRTGGNSATNATPADYTKVRGATHAALSRDGTSNTIMFAESREEDFTSWVSGMASYVVAADPQGPGKVIKVNSQGAKTQITGQPMVLGWETNQPGQTALNIGSNVKRAGGTAANGSTFDAQAGQENLSGSGQKKAYYYQTPWSHATGNISRIYGPSSAHSGDIVLHGYGDGHGKPVAVSVDRNSYLHQVTRSGGEIVNVEN
jgi:hypothetical protein